MVVLPTLNKSTSSRNGHLSGLCVAAYSVSQPALDVASGLETTANQLALGTKDTCNQDVTHACHPRLSEIGSKAFSVLF